jgi:hypothetical protein
MEKSVPDTVTETATKPRDPVAIIAIHGVGNQEPGDTARTLAELLQRDQTTEHTTGAGYSTFDEHQMVLPVVPIKDELGLNLPESPERTTWLISQSEFMKTGQLKLPRPERGEPPLDVAFTRACVNLYDAAKHSQSYGTSILKGHRHETGKPDQPVHIFEMYWGDLSRLSNAWLAILGEFYQLLLHAGSIARITAELQAKSAEQRGVKQPLLSLLRTFQWLVTSGIWLSTVPLVAANLVLAGVAVTVLPLAIDRVDTSPYAWLGGLVLAALIGYVILYALRVYNARRPGVFKWGVAIMAIAVVVGLVSMALKGDYRTNVIRVVEVIFNLFWPMTLLIIACIVGALITGALCVAFKSQSKPRAPAITQGVITTLVAMIVPLALSCAVTVLLWAGGAFAFKKALKEDRVYDSILPDALFQLPSYLQPSRWPSGKFEVASQTNYVEFLLAHGGSEAFNWLIAGLGWALALLVAGTILSIRHELMPPRGDKAATRWRLALGGMWLNAGLTWIPFIGFLILVALGALAMWLPVSGFCSNRAAPFWCSNDLLRNAGLVVTTSSAGLLAIAKAYGHGLKALRPGIDLALDVDNWLRERPRYSNPRAKVLSRYLALFKHLHQDGYREIVIVAHSQGTVITADFLRLLKHFRWREGLKIRLFTLGSPLRQLYAERFPDLYGWVTENGGPEPNKLYGVEYWLNGYRTGDYVGRALWEDLIDNPNFRFGPEPRDLITHTMLRRENHAEFSLGAGAHTHYFDYTAPLVGVAIDALVAMRVAATATVRPLVR